MLILDTDHLSLLDRESGAAARRLSDRLSAVASEGIATTVVNFEEQMCGWLAYLAQARTVARHIEAYRRLGRHLDRYRNITVLDFDERAGPVFLTRARVGKALLLRPKAHEAVPSIR